MIRYILGRRGSDKTARLMQEIGAALQYKQPLYLVVPEQFTLQAELMLTETLDLPAMMDLQVLSPSRLMYRVLKEAGGASLPTLDEQGRQMAMRSVLMRLDGKLAVYRGAWRRSGFVQEALRLGDELRQGDLSPTSLRLAADALPDGGLFASGLYDLAAIQEDYEELLADRAMSEEEAMARFVRGVDRVQSLRETRIWVDGFDLIPPRTRQMLAALATVCKELTVTFQMDAESRRQEQMFAPVQENYAALRALAQQRGVQEERELLPRGEFYSAEIAHLESELFAYPWNAYQGECEDIRLHACAQMYDECQRAAEELLRLHVERGIDYGQMSVACSDMAAYGAAMERACRKRGIPCYVDRQLAADKQPALMYWLSGMEAALRGFGPEETLACLKSGFAPLSREETEGLELYMLEMGLRGKRWEQRAEKESIEEARLRFIEPLLHFARNAEQAENGRALCMAALQLLQEAGVYEALQQETDRLNEAGNFAAAGMAAQVWQHAMHVLEQAEQAFGEEQMPAWEFVQCLRSGLECVEISTLPPTPGQVTIGALGRFKSQGLEALLVLGVVDGLVPAPFGAKSLLGGEERQRVNRALNEAGVREHMRGAMEHAQQERYVLYGVLTAPTRVLELFWPLAGDDGRARRESAVIGHIRRLFPRLQVQGALQTWYSRRADVALWQAAQRISQGEQQAWGVFHAAEKLCPQQAELAREAMHVQSEPQRILPATAKRLYGERSSITQLEQHARCPFMHFVQRGLRPSIVRERHIRDMDEGSFCHDALEGFSRALAGRWERVQQEDCGKLMQSVLDALEIKWSPMVRTGRDKARLLQLKRTAMRMAGVVHAQIVKGSFRPWGQELSFGPNATFPPLVVQTPQGRLLLEGRIDRVDICDEDGERFIRIVDYKTGRTDLKMEEIYYGIRLQLLLYLDAALQAVGGKPAGIFYLKVDDPLLETPERAQQVVSPLLARRMRLSGLVLEDVKVLGAMDAHAEENGESDVVNIKKPRKGSVPNALSLESFEKLLLHQRRMAAHLAGRILQGNVQPLPLRSHGSSPCEYCEYRSLCRRDETLPGTAKERMVRIGGAEALQRMEEGSWEGLE